MDAPLTEAELLARARAIAGHRLGELAGRFGLAVPADFRRAKGWVGQLLERSLGAASGSRARPDFDLLGVELKTVPVDARGRPRESTFVCTIALADIGDVEWEVSLVRSKLARVLWIPIQADPRVPVADRHVAEPLLWSPTPDEEAGLRFDYEELAGRIGRGDVESITGRLGRFLQIRPKGADSRARVRAFDSDGTPFDVLPRGFYLRSRFTARILGAHYRLPG